ALHCIDSICYHTGGPLAIGDIEEVNGDLCIRCPWHDYDVRLEDGAKPYQSMKFDPATKKLVPDGWKFTRNTQRTHEVVLREGAAPEGGIWVRLSTEGKFESDQFAYNDNAAKNVARGDRTFAPDGKSPDSPEKSGTSGYKRSGEVIAEMRAKASAQKMPPPPALLTQPATLQSLHPLEWRPFRLLSKKQLAGSVWLFRFALPADQQLGWSSLRHVRMRIPLPKMDGTGPAAVEREYTPVSPLGRTGCFDLAVQLGRDIRRKHTPSPSLLHTVGYLACFVKGLHGAGFVKAHAWTTRPASECILTHGGWQRNAGSAETVTSK
ncbi:Rfesd, partial [Symbiodinium sp. CCMP2456]